EPVLLLETEDHRNAREREPDVDLARELVAEPAGARAGGAGSERRLPLEQDHAPDPRRREVVGGARSHGAAAHDHDVGRAAHRPSRRRKEPPGSVTPTAGPRPPGRSRGPRTPRPPT